MGRIVILVDTGAGFGPEALAGAWNADAEAEAASAGAAVVEPAAGEVFFPGLVELVVVPLAVNVASSAVYDLVKKLAVRLRPPAGVSRRWPVPRSRRAAGTCSS
jgi:hypothetical protein